MILGAMLMFVKISGEDEMILDEALSTRSMLRERKIFLEKREQKEQQEYNEDRHNYIVCTDNDSMEFIGVGDGQVAVCRLEQLRMKNPQLTFITERITGSYSFENKFPEG